MGYGGYVSAKLPPAKPTEVEAAVQVRAADAARVGDALLWKRSPRARGSASVLTTQAGLNRPVLFAHGELRGESTSRCVVHSFN